MATAGIHMTAAVEEFLRHLVARKVVNRAQTDPHNIVASVVLAQRYGQSHALDAQRFVDESLHIALDKVKTLHVMTRYGEVGSVHTSPHIHLLRDEIPPQPHGPLAVIVEHIAVYLVLVDAFSKQLTDNEEYLWRVGIVGETARICHHTAIYGHRALPWPQSPQVAR